MGNYQDNDRSVPSDLELLFRLRITEPDEEGNPGGRDILLEQLIEVAKTKTGYITFDLSDKEVFTENNTFFVILDLIVDDIDNYHGVYPLISMVNRGENPFMRQFGIEGDWNFFRLKPRHEMLYDIWYEY